MTALLKSQFLWLLWLALLIGVPLLLAWLVKKTHLIHPGITPFAHSANLSRRVHQILAMSTATRPTISRRQRCIVAVLMLALIISSVGTGLQPERLSTATNSALPAAPPSRPASPANQVQEPTTLTVALPNHMLEGFTHNFLALDEFEAAHPGIQVKLLNREFDYRMVLSFLEDPQSHLDSAAAYASKADVLYVPAPATVMTPLATRAGYFLDLAPLAAADPTFFPEDYYPAAYESYRWEGGLWALPFTLNPAMMLYDYPAFDAAGLAYPNPSWGMAEYGQAAYALAEFEGDSEVAVKAGLNANPYPFFRALLGREPGYFGAMDPNGPPDFAGDEQLLRLARSYISLAQNGVITPFSMSSDITHPMQLLDSYSVAGNPSTSRDDENWASTTLPGNGAVLLDATAFAVSAGTAHPELAYQLAKHITEQSTVAANASMGFQRMAAYRGGDGPVSRSLPNSLASDFDLMAASLAYPMSPYHFALDYQINRLISEKLPVDDLVLVLTEVGDQLATSLALGDSTRAAGVTIVLDPFVPALEVPPGQVALKFHTQMTEREINLDQWQALADEFAAQDETVFHLEVLTGDFISGVDQPDCYLDTRLINTQSLASLGTQILIDRDFNESKLIPGILEQVKYDRVTYGYPLAVFPEVLWLNHAAFSQAGITPPTDEWTVSEFTAALEALGDDRVMIDAPYHRVSQNRTDWLLLMAAYGGLPIDYRTDPATINLTNPATVEAMRQVLDLIKGSSNDGTTFGITADNLQNLMPLLLNPADSGGHVIGYPHGTTYNPLAYGLLAGYIPYTSQSIDSCYRWFKYLADHAELFPGLPVWQTERNLAVISPMLHTLLDDFIERMSDPTTIAMPLEFSGGNPRLGMVEGMWVNEIFDLYLADGADLATLLTTRQGWIEEYQLCFDAVPEPQDPSGIDGYMEAMVACAVASDPDAADKPPLMYLAGD